MRGSSRAAVAEGRQSFETALMSGDPAVVADELFAVTALLDDNAALATFATTLETVCVDTVEAGFMTKDLALLIGPDQDYLTTQEFLAAIDENLQKAMSAA